MTHQPLRAVLSIATVILAGSAFEAADRPSVVELPRVRVIATGGTIAGKRPLENKGSKFCFLTGPYGGPTVSRCYLYSFTAPNGALGGADLVKRVPELAGVADVSVEEFSRIGSSRMTPELQHRLALRVNELLASADAPAGIVITHGTDTLEETAFLLDLFVDSERPVVFAAAQRVPTEPDSDGPRNLLNAVRIAASPDARGMGVLVTLNSEIHAAADVRKTHAIALDTFKSPGVGPIGYVDGSHVVISRKPARRLTLKPGGVEDRVELLTLTAGSNGRLIDAAAAWSQGIVVEVFGRGNATLAIMGAVGRAREKGVIVVFTTRTRGGRVELDNEAQGLGVISGQDLDRLKARMLLVASLPLTRDLATLQSYFDRLGGISPRDIALIVLACSATRSDPARCHRRCRVAEGLVDTRPEFPAAGAGVRRLA